MISRLYQLRYDLPESKLINTDEFARKIPEIPRLAATNGYYSYEGEVGKLLAVGRAGQPPAAQAGVVPGAQPDRYCGVLVPPVHQAPVPRQAGADQPLDRSPD